MANKWTKRGVVDGRKKVAKTGRKAAQTAGTSEDVHF
jgi:hypothetical protein